MAIFTRFECPRCQTVFVKEGADDAFADCPECQSMALAIGETDSVGTPDPAPPEEVTSVRAPSLASAEGTGQFTAEGASPDVSGGEFSEETVQAPTDGASGGVFSGLLSESGIKPDVTNDDMRVPATLEGMPSLGGGPELASQDNDAPDEFNEERTVEMGDVADQLLAQLAAKGAAEAEAADDDDPTQAGGFDPFADVSDAFSDEAPELAPTDIMRPQAEPPPPSDERTIVGPAPTGPSGDIDFGFDDDDDDEDAAWEDGPPASVPTKANQEPVSDNAAMDLTRQDAPASVPSDENPALALTRQDAPAPAAEAPQESTNPSAPAPISAAENPALALTRPEELDEDAWENGPPESALPRPPGGPSGRPADRLPELTPEPGSTGAMPLEGSDFSMDMAVHEEPAAQSPQNNMWDPSFNSGEIEQPSGAVLLSQLEAQMSGATNLGNPNEASGLGLDTMGALEAAFDQVAGGPPAGGRAEDALRQAGFDAAHSAVSLPTSASDVAGAAVPAPPDVNEPPSLRRARRQGVQLQLSEEAKALAGISIAPEAGSHNLAFDLTRMSTTDRGSAISDEGGPVLGPPSTEGPSIVDSTLEVPALVRDELERPALSEADDLEVTDDVRPERARKRAQGAVAEEEEPGALAGFTALRVAAAVLLFVLVGGGAGVLIAPEAKAKPTTSRARAEQRFIEGNRYYGEERFDDALGSYRGAITLDKTYGPAFRAKAAVLAKQKRIDEAAVAYRKYLEISPSAVDADAVREILARYDGKPSG
jgi:tetratricopeptide (TPR) repeat protein